MISGFDDKLIALIESHPSIIVGTCDRALVPCIARAFGARIIDGGAAIELIVSRWPGPQTVNNLQQSDRIAVTFTAPETFEAYQVKAHVRFLGDCDEMDIERVATYTATIRARIVSLNEPLELAKTIFTPHGLYKLRIDPDSVFLQTPGKNAGARV